MLEILQRVQDADAAESHAADLADEEAGAAREAEGGLSEQTLEKLLSKVGPLHAAQQHSDSHHACGLATYNPWPHKRSQTICGRTLRADKLQPLQALPRTIHISWCAQDNSALLR